LTGESHRKERTPLKSVLREHHWADVVPDFDQHPGIKTINALHQLLS
jgi:hypothetical protein